MEELQFWHLLAIASAPTATVTAALLATFKYTTRTVIDSLKQRVNHLEENVMRLEVQVEQERQHSRKLESYIIANRLPIPNGDPEKEQEEEVVADGETTGPDKGAS